MSLKELRAMLKEQRKTAMPPVSKMKKGALMREVLSAEQILHKSRASTVPEPLFGATYGAEEITRPGAKQFARVSAKKAEGKIIGASVHEERLYDVNDAVGARPINRRSLAKKSMAQADEPVPATQKVVPAAKKQSAKKTMLAQMNEPIGNEGRSGRGCGLVCRSYSTCSESQKFSVACNESRERNGSRSPCPRAGKSY